MLRGKRPSTPRSTRPPLGGKGDQGSGVFSPAPRAHSTILRACFSLFAGLHSLEV